MQHGWEVRGISDNEVLDINFSVTRPIGRDVNVVFWRFDGKVTVFVQACLIDMSVANKVLLGPY